MKKIKIKIGKLIFSLDSYKELSVDMGLENFIYRNETSGMREIFVRILEMKQEQKISGSFRGRDGILEYYQEDDRYFCRDIPARDGSACLVQYSPEKNEVIVYLNDAIFPNAFPSFNKVIQMLPLREFFTDHEILMLHSSQVYLSEINIQKSVGNSIIFTASSGTGKTTQAKLWKQYENAKLISNDRTVFYQEQEELFSMGYFVDGSEPVYNEQSVKPAAIVCLAQGPVNQIERLKPSKALSLLMSQTVADAWNPEEKAKIQLLWFDIIQKIPVYLLSCTPDQDAVACLKNRLINDKIIVWRNEDEIN